MFKNKTKLSLIIVLLIVCAFGFLAVSDVWARAGGGQDFVPSSGGGFDFDSGSSFDSDFDTDYSGGTSFVPVPCGGGWVGFVIFIIVIIVISAIVKKAKRNLRNNPDFKSGIQQMKQAVSGMTGTAGTNVANVPAELAKLKQKDPNFNEQSFQDYAQNAFYKIQEAWEQQDLSIARPYLTDQLLQRYTNQINDIQSRGEKNVLENMVVGHMDITGIRSDAEYDYITLKIDASAADYTTDSSGKIIRGDKKIRPFSEYWTFLRKGTVKTDDKKGFKANTCPNCGAPLQVNATGQCEYCNTIVTSGDYDWVLSEIEQAR